MEQDNLCTSWNFLPWKIFHRKSSSLQRKIYEAKEEKNNRSIKRLQKLLLRSKSIYYISVKKVTDYYSSKGIFLSQKIKSDLVNEVYLHIYKWKNSLSVVKPKANFGRFIYLKDEVIAYIMDYLITPVCGYYYESPLYFTHIKNSIKVKSSLKLLFNRSVTISLLPETYFLGLKSLLTLPEKYKHITFRSLSSVTPNFYSGLNFMNFRVNLQSLYFSLVLLHLKNLKRIHFLKKLGYSQKNLSSSPGKLPNYFIQIRLKYENILFLYKRFVKISGLRLNFNRLK